jgi:hypothetical protein
MEVAQSNVEPTNDISPPVSKWKVIKEAHGRRSQGEIKLNDLIDHLKNDTIVEEEKEVLVTTTTCDRIRLFRRYIANFLQQPKFHYVVILLVITDLIVVLIDLVLGMCFFRKKILIYNSIKILF